MVRFQWHVEDGFQATIPPGGIQPHRDAGDVWHLTMHTEVAGQKDPLESLITLPKGYMGDSEVVTSTRFFDTPQAFAAQIRRTGIILAHGTQPDHKSKLLTELAVTLASKGMTTHTRAFLFVNTKGRHRLSSGTLPVPFKGAAAGSRPGKNA